MTTDADRLSQLEAMAEEAYEAMYEAHNASGAAAFYSEAKECYYAAIALARQMGALDEAARIEERLAHVKAVFRSQFT